MEGQAQGLNIYIAGIPLEWREEKVHGMFQEYGQIDSVKVLMDLQSNTSRGVAFVKYIDSSHAQNAILATNNMEIQGKPVQVRLARDKSTNFRRNGYQDPVVYVAGFPKTWSTKEVEVLMAPYGELTYSKLLLDNNNMGRGVAFVRFANPTNAFHAMEALNGTRLQDSPTGLQVRWARHNYTHQQQQQHQPYPNYQQQYPGMGAGGGGQGGGGGKYPPMMGGPMMMNNQMGTYNPNSYNPNNYNPNGNPGIPVQNYGGNPYAPYGMPTKGGPNAPFYGNPGAGGGNMNLNQLGHVNPMSRGDMSMPPQPMNNMGGMMPAGQTGGYSGCCLFVMHLPADWKESDLYNLFKDFGPIRSARVMIDLQTGASKGYGFVDFVQYPDAEKAIHGLNGYRIGYKQLRISFKTPKNK